MKRELGIGMVVCLKSGGPKMTIQSVFVNTAHGEMEARCVWFCELETRWDIFKIKSLRIVEAK